ncbi:MAG: hypothetical protein M1153_00355 [Patescibacteria group bacterium]|nr:hypothetical protein [Patescibacteria group bacterium]
MNNKENEDKIVEIDFPWAETVFLEMIFKPGKETDETAMANLISQSVWGFFEDNRRRIAGNLGLEELDAVLADARIVAAESDGRKEYSLEKLASSAKPVKIAAYATVAARDKLPASSRAVIEPASVKARLLNLRQKMPVIYLESRASSTQAYFASPSAVRKLSSWPWGLDRLAEKMGERLMTSPEVNKEIYLRYINNEVSEGAAKAIGEQIGASLKDFDRGLAATLYNNKQLLPDKPRAKIFLKSYFPLPDTVYRRKVVADGKRLTINRLDEEITARNLFAEEEVIACEELNKISLQKTKWLMA